MADLTDTYYPSKGIHGYGAQLLVSDGAATPVFTAIAQINKITPGDMSTAIIDKTHLRSPEAHREKMAGIRDSGPFQLEGTWNPAEPTHSNAGGGLVALWRTRKECDFKIVLNDGDPAATPTPIENTEWPFRGVVTKFQPGEIGVDDKINFTAEITPLQDFSADLP